MLVRSGPAVGSMRAMTVAASRLGAAGVLVRSTPLAGIGWVRTTALFAEGLDTSGMLLHTTARPGIGPVLTMSVPAS